MLVALGFCSVSATACNPARVAAFEVYIGRRVLSATVALKPVTQEVESMERRAVDSDAVKRTVKRSTVDSARLERREVPAGFVRSAGAENFLAERRTGR